MKEIGGYIELDSFHLPMLHEGALALNCGRNALAYLLRARKISKLWLPRFICNSLTDVCKREHVAYEMYRVGLDFEPEQEICLKEGEWLLFVNFYGLFQNDRIAAILQRYKRVIVDQTQSYFQPPISNADTFYSCRKYFGVADGAFLYTDVRLNQELPVDKSYNRMRFLMGRYECTASDFYSEYVANNQTFKDAPICKMSKLTDNFLHAVDYDKVEAIRTRNYAFLHAALNAYNALALPDEPGSFMYPFMVEDGAEIRRELQREKIYIPTLWPSVFEFTGPGDHERRMASDILPLPIDQRYTVEDMKYLVSRVKDFLQQKKV